MTYSAFAFISFMVSLVVTLATFSILWFKEEDKPSVATNILLLVYFCTVWSFMPTAVTYFTDDLGAFSSIAEKKDELSYTDVSIGTNIFLAHDSVQSVLSNNTLDRYDNLVIEYTGKKQSFSFWIKRYLGLTGLCIDINDITDVKATVDTNTTTLKGVFRVEETKLGDTNVYKVGDKYFSASSDLLKSLVGNMCSLEIKYDNSEVSNVISSYIVNKCEE